LIDAPKVSEETARRLLKRRAVDSHKGDNGIVLVVGGSWLYHGAPFLSATAAERTGVDLVYLCVPESNVTAIRALSPNLIVIPRPDVKLTVGAVNKVMKWIPEKKINATVIGPGLGRQNMDGVVKLISELKLKGSKILLDADALRTSPVAAAKNAQTVITPHAGEFQRIFNVEPEKSIETRVNQVRDLAEKSGVTILLKGHISVISDGKHVAINDKGTPAMTVGGTGDVLSGVVAGLLAKGLEPFDAASLGAYFNGLAGEAAANKLGMHILASDLVEELAKVMMPFD
jgi:ADP-dependent NAD(P)H-hydrate dehydratase